MGFFGWSYPPGCSGPPEEPEMSPEGESVWAMLENVEVDEAVIEQVCKVVEELVIKANAECPQCLERWAEAEQNAMDEFHG